MRNAITQLSLAALAVVVTGCATMTKETYILESAGAHVFEASSPEILDEAERMLKEKGYSVRRSPEQHALVTEWKEEMASSTIAASMTRYLVEVFPIAPRQSRVRITRNSAVSASAQQAHDSYMTTDEAGENVELNDNRSQAAAREYASGQQGGSRRTTSGANQTRDLQMEWELMKRMHPEDARELEAVAADKFR